jgi:two-component system OmpR family sensor kinase
MTAWWAQLERSSIRTHLRLSLAGVVLVLAVTVLASAASVVWASATLSRSADRVVALQTANRDVLQGVTDAETGIRGYGISSDRSALNPYVNAVNWLPQDQRRLRDLATDHPDLLAAVDVQEQAISRWLTRYATPRLAQLDGGATGRDRLFPVGKALFEDVREANQDLDARLEDVTEAIQARARTVLWATLGMLALLPLVAGVFVALVVRRLGRSVVEPLTGIAEVLEQLRAGAKDARAPVSGPVEIRTIAEELNSLNEENLRASEVEADVLHQLQTIDRVRTDLISTVSHELRTPLTSVTGYLELLSDELDGDLNPQQAAMMAAVGRNLDRLNELITNLLVLSRAEGTQLVAEPLDLRGVAAEVAADIRLTAAGRGITVRTLQSVAPVVVLGDRSQLTRAVQNLVTNAVKFSSAGDAVELRVTQEGREAVLEVVDEGIGIPTADLPGLGSRFYRATNAVRAEIAGTGLGLRIVQTILDRHDGSLTVESVEGEGSTFTIRLPVSRGSFDQPSSGPAPAERSSAWGAGTARGREQSLEPTPGPSRD